MELSSSTEVVPAPLSPAVSSRAPLGMVLQPVLEPSSEPLPLEDLILWQAFMEMNYQAPTTFHTFCVLHLHFLLPLHSIPPQWPPRHMQALPTGHAILWPYAPGSTSIPHIGHTLASLSLLRQVPQLRRPSFPISASWYTSYPSGLPRSPPYSLLRAPGSHNQPVTLRCVHSILYPSLCIKVSYSQFPSPATLGTTSS